ncbi:response regulator [Clostridium autoethanogenum]|uniref:Transcriptional regulatory protein n=1 Tax=Clostridium autoethanogenum DSM 10061 TaxID=1341692 RepID=A0ABM5NWE0_9CLOT|nr:response regulator [Clostridium autoethanogenum]AGY76694.1 response regulator [Clostridium autoethanogenum DSM 10061]ALU36849.1 Response regulator receiver and unknown domain protein [Clostridium autoethanogenum DSM 10061]OVY50461.1 Transcriptional regulatory protein DcuR [Clostridium autoethanogenum]
MIKVLIVEDDPMVCELNKRYLSQINGFKLVDTASSFEEAVKVLKKSQIDLILLDIFMPGKNGLDLFKYIRKLNGEVDVIIVSAACDINVIKKSLHLGVVDYLIKPFEFERFNSALSSYRDAQNFIKGNNVINQKDLDNYILNKDQQTISNLPKGLDKNTLQNVWTSILKVGIDDFSTVELAEMMGMSRVSMRKYLEFLHRIGVLTMNIEYGLVGRPEYKYKCINFSGNFLMHY